MEYQSIQHLPPPHPHHHHQHQPHLHYYYQRFSQHQQQQPYPQAVAAAGPRLSRAVATALQDSQIPSGRWSVSSEVSSLRLSASTHGTPIASPGPTSGGNSGVPAVRSVSVLSGSEYVRVVNARGVQRLVRRKLRQGAVPPAAVRGVGAKIHERCVSGCSRIFYFVLVHIKSRFRGSCLSCLKWYYIGPVHCLSTKCR
ncbi:hypothetical protein PoB_006489400 [Plakobranchus ocellatus]|uniref:Uncharacterized protein n=1 Tax=Plakobranchus ocellatus TaxID=259542 RepID=A0AAV4D2L7_9GAST|nr:hypothetical protein PoB_006489400 [Plakobranchus ocellatus]